MMSKQTFTIKLPKDEIPKFMANLERVKMYAVDLEGYELVRTAEIKLVAEEAESKAIRCEPMIAAICFAFICVVVIGISWMMWSGM
jgi:preprotein translocase subunit Sec61beta